MLSVQGLSVRYGSLAALDGVAFGVADGDVLALLGPSGCGKSTLLRAIAGLEPVTAGTIRWDGVDLARIPVHRRGFGLMFQEGVLFPHRTVAGNVGYGLRGRPGAAGRVAELLDLVGLGGYGPRRVATLSGGEAQRVALARALAPRPRLLLLDEPLAALDRSLRDQLLADLRGVFAATGTTAIFVTHDQAEAFAIADRVAVMRAGALLQVGTPGEVWARPVDGWTARFLGCAAVIPARPRRGPDGTWCSDTALGPVPGRTRQVGLRPGALVVDRAGTLRGRITSVTPGPREQRLGVLLEASTAGGADVGDGGDGPGGRTADRPDRIGGIRAVADPAERIAVGDTVTLRWDPGQAVPIGADRDTDTDTDTDTDPGTDTGTGTGTGTHIDTGTDIDAAPGSVPAATSGRTVAGGTDLSAIPR